MFAGACSSFLSIVVAAASSGGGTADDGLRIMPVDSDGLAMAARAAWMVMSS